jgi:hypothetical protein
MIAFPPGVRVWLATGHTDMRRGTTANTLGRLRKFTAVAWTEPTIRNSAWMSPQIRA